MISRLRSAAPRPGQAQGQAQGRGPRVASDWAVWAALAATVAAYVWGHAVHGLSPRSSIPIEGWWHWTDQGRYLRAALAWASGDLDPARHWYPAGYPLLGAAFSWLTPAQPFYLPDLAGLAAFAWLFARLAARLAPGVAPPAAPPPAASRTDRRDGPAGAIPPRSAFADRPFGDGSLRDREGPRSGPLMAGALGAAVFLATTVFSRPALSAWIIPWTTTPTAVLTLAGLVQALRFADAPRPRNAFFLGLIVGGLGLFRPTDAAIVLLALGPFAAWVLLRGRSVRRAAAAAGAGVLPPVLALFALHHAVNGWDKGPYFGEAATAGFEWSLVPLRWVMLFVAPQPLFPSGQGLAQAFPWIVPGVAGMAACLALPDRRLRPRHALVVGTVALHCAFYLAYRDLHPQGLFRYHNYHYFKWVLPVFGLYAALLVLHLAASPRRLRVAGVGLLAAAGLFCWRAEWRPDPGRAGDVAVTGPGGFVVRGGFRSTADAVLLAAPGGFEQVYLGRHTLRVDGRTGHANTDLKAFPVPGGLLFAPLRRFPARDTTAVLEPPLRIDPAVPAVVGTQRAVFGLPCWAPGLFGRCGPAKHLPAPALEPGRAVAFGGADAPYLLGGWSSDEPGGRWTEAAVAELRFRTIEPAGSTGPELALQARAFVPDERHPVRLTAYANGERVAVWDFTDGLTRTVRARIPAGAIDADGSVRLRLVVDGARRPKDYGTSADGRELGLFVHSLEVTGAEDET